jgi:hypothetical protein
MKCRLFGELRFRGTQYTLQHHTRDRSSFEPTDVKLEPAVLIPHVSSSMSDMQPRELPSRSGFNHRILQSPYRKLALLSDYID